MEEYEKWVLRVRQAIAALSNTAYDNGIVAANPSADRHAIREVVQKKYDAHEALIELLGLEYHGRS